jgi:peptidoglycan-N-acetylglucosamine deacetylase
VTSAETPRSRDRSAVLVYDRLYRFLHGLDTAASEVGSAIRIEVRRSHRTLQLASGTTIRPGDRIGVLHLNNAFVAALHAGGLPPIAAALGFRRQLLSSLHELARFAGPGGRLTGVKAFSATTIFFHQGLAQLGFEAEDRAPAWPRIVTAYQRALLATLRPAGPGRLRRATYHRSRRLWISRENLLARYGAVARPSR